MVWQQADLAWLATAVWFGAAHLPTYGWKTIFAFAVVASLAATAS